MGRPESTIRAEVGYGRRWREDGQQLFVSKKTVETHLGGIYRKLDVSSREKLAEALQATSGDPAA